MNESILEKLKKLIRHERSAREIGSLHEAANFAAKIQQLLDDYNLSLSDIDVEEARSTVDGVMTKLNTTHYWQKIFLQDVAEISGCRMIVARSPYVCLVGNEVDRLVTAEVFSYFEALGRDLAKFELSTWQSTADYRRKRKKTFHSRRYTTSFLLGYIRSVTLRMKAQKRASMAAANSETGLIYIGNKLADADAWLKGLKTVKKPSKIKASAIRDDAYIAGRVAGNAVALTTKTVS